MTFENLENIISLLCTITGLLYSVFKYIETPKRGYRYLTGFFIANFIGEYYWTVYELVMGSSPNVSGFTVYLGWNVAIVFLLLAVFYMRHKEAMRLFHPIILLPILTNIPQFILYIRYGDVLNNLWQLGITTIIMIFCLQEIIYCQKNRKILKIFPWLSVIVLVYLAAKYCMWTASCFDWSSELANPYFYCSLLSSLLSMFFAYGAGKYYEVEDSETKPKSASEMRFQVLILVALSLVIIGICAVGYCSAIWFKTSLQNENGFIRNEGQLVFCLFAISVVMVLLIMVLLYVLTRRYRDLISSSRLINDEKTSQLNFIVTIAVTLALMVFAVIYNNAILYNSSVIGIYEDAEAEIKTNSTELENYLTVAATTLRVAADSVELMEKSGSSTQEIEQYIVDQTTIQSNQFDDNFTGIYAYINGEYLDGLRWVPPEDYEPTERDWYKAAVKANGEVVIVSPYVDAQTGSVVITIGKGISGADSAEGELLKNVVCLDVIVNHIQEITDTVEIAEKGYGMVVNEDGFIIAHQDRNLNGKNITEVYDQNLLSSITKVKSGRFTTMIDDEECTLFIAPVMDQWYSVIVIGSSELFESTYSQLAVNILVSFITFCLITFFYYIGYRNEQISGRKVEEMNLQVVTALATAIDAKDNYTNGHSSRVAEYSRMIAARSGYSKSEQEEIYMMGLLHDVGKIGVPDSVINKPAKLTEEEFDLIKKHPVIGNDILERIKERPKLAVGARWHHERYGGGGYPDGISGEQIPEEARIIAVADAYDAMSSRRSYRDVMPQDKVRSEIKKGSGTQFDPRFAEVMLQMIDEDKDYSMHER